MLNVKQNGFNLYFMFCMHFGLLMIRLGSRPDGVDGIQSTFDRNAIKYPNIRDFKTHYQYSFRWNLHNDLNIPNVN